MNKMKQMETKMKSFSYSISIPFFVFKDDKTMPVTSMVLSTLVVCAVTTFVPQLMPLWMAMASRSTV
jgi:diacylglycerol kinase